MFTPLIKTVIFTTDIELGFEVAVRLCSTPHCRTYRRKSPHTKAQRGGTSAVQPLNKTYGTKATLCRH
jgi:hypothetical protein